MNTQIVKKLILKDWDLLKQVIASYSAAGILALSILGLGHEYAFHVGSIFLISVLFGAGFHCIMVSTIAEQKEQTLPFIMSLPVNPFEFAWAKIIANLTVFIVPCLVVVIGIFFVVLYTPIKAGLLPIALIVCAQILVGFCLVLAIAIIFESEGVTIVSMVLSSMSLNVCIRFVSEMDGISPYLNADVAVWNSTAFSVLAVQFSLSILFLAMTAVLQARKRVFL